MIKRILTYIILFLFCAAKLTAQSHFHPLVLDENNKEFIANCTFRTPEGLLWIGTTNGLLFYNGYKTIRFQNDIENNYSLSDNHILCIYMDSQNTLWIGTRNGLNKYNPQNKSFERITFNQNPELNQRVNNIQEDAHKNLWISIEELGLTKLSLLDSSIEIFPINNSTITSLHIQNKQIWIGTNQNIQLFNIENKNFKIITSFQEIHSIKSIKEDSKGNIWMAGWQNGLYKIDTLNFKVSDVHSGLKSKSIFDIYIQNDTNLLIATFDSGLYQYNTYTNSAINITPKLGASAKSFRNIYSCPFGDAWFSTNKGILRRSTFPYLFPNTCFTSTNNEQTQRSWIQNTDSIFNIDKRLQSIKADREDISCLAYESDSTVWIGLWTNGVLHHNFNSQEQKNYKPNKNSNLSYGFINSIYIDELKQIWLASNSGLNKFESEKNDFTQYHVSPQIKTDIFYSILPDSNKNFLWLSSNMGIARFDKANGIFLLFDKENNVPAVEFIPNSAKIEDGKLIFGAKTGVFSFTPNQIKLSNKAPVISIAKIKLNNAVIPIEENITLNLQSGQNKLEITMQSSNIIHANKTHFKYILEGNSDQWIYNGNNHIAVFNNLNAGHFQFRFKATNAEMNWSDAYSLKIEAKKTSIGLVLSIIVTLVIVLTIIVLKLKPSKQSKYAKSNISESELKEYFNKFEKLMVSEKPYTDKAVYLDEIAKTLDINANYLSQAINKISGGNFFDYVNKYRVEEAKRLLLENKTEKLNLMGIGFEAGFNSKSSFYSVFKKHTGMTPAQYRKKHLEK